MGLHRIFEGRLLHTEQKKRIIVYDIALSGRKWIESDKYLIELNGYLHYDKDVQ